jgi:hypothetical protein
MQSHLNSGSTFQSWVPFLERIRINAIFEPLIQRRAVQAMGTWT